MEENTPVPALPPGTGSTEAVQNVAETEPKSKPPIGLIIAGLVFFVLIIVGVVFLLRADNATTGRVRDVFIILMALESFVLGIAMIILIVQLATLINLLQNEIKPIITSTNETVNTLRGTVSFLSDNISEPVIRLNAYLASIKQFIDIIRPSRHKSR